MRYFYFEHTEQGWVNGEGAGGVHTDFYCNIHVTGILQKHSVMPLLSGAPLLRKILNLPLLSHNVCTSANACLLMGIDKYFFVNQRHTM